MTTKPTKTVTLREILVAARKNGVPHIHGDFFYRGKYSAKHNTYAINGACALGQAGVNLGINPMKLHGKRVKAADGSRRLPFNAIISLNDNDKTRHLTLTEIADDVEKRYADVLDVPVEAEVVDFSKGYPAHL